MLQTLARAMSAICLITFIRGTTTLEIDSCQPSSSPTQVILLTYRRSGSSYTGELVASHNNASYFFEPLYYPDFVLNDSSPAAHHNVMLKLMNCDSDLLDAMRQQKELWIMRKFLSQWDTWPDTYDKHTLAHYCSCSPVRVYKTIRLRMADALRLLEFAPEAKIVHLVRDPRARYSSAVAKGGSWTEAERSLDTICGEMQADLDVRSPLLTKKNYVRIRYEDVATDPMGQVRALYRQLLGWQDVPGRVNTYVTNHKAPGADPNDYYSTYRPPDFDPNHWKTVLDRESIDMIQNHCGSLIKELGYEFI